MPWHIQRPLQRDNASHDNSTAPCRRGNTASTCFSSEASDANHATRGAGASQSDFKSLGAEEQCNATERSLTTYHWKDVPEDKGALQRLLPRANVEVEISFQTVEPIGRMVLAIDRGDGICTHFDLDRVSSPQRLSVLPIERHRGFGAGIIGHETAQDDMVGKYHGPEGQDVGTHGCNQDGRHATGWRRINHMSKEQQRQLNTTYGCTTEDPAASE